MEKKLKIILAVVVTMLIAIISFVGVYTKDGVVFKSNLPNYQLSSDFENKRIVSFIPSEDENEIIYDKDGNKVEAIPEGANEEDYRKEKEKVNKAESLTAENFEKVKETFEKRLNSLGANYYEVRLDKETGNIAVELEDNLNTDLLLEELLYKGDFSITDSESGNVLIDKANVKSSDVAYRNTEEGVTVYLDIKFDKEGAKKLQEISKEYLKPEEEGEEAPKKQVAIVMEGAKVITTNFSEEIKTGNLTLSIGTSKDNEKIQEYVEQTQLYTRLINNPTLVLDYDIGVEKTVDGNLSGNVAKIIIVVVSVVFAIIVIYFICRFKLNGLIAGVSMIMSTSLLLLALRYTNTDIALNTFVRFHSTYDGRWLLNKQDTKQYKK